MSAARKKGKWVGGCPVLGYDLDRNGGRLAVNEAEAEQVRAIFGLFEENGSIALTLAEVERHGWKLKSWTRRTGMFREGGRFTVMSLRRLLSNILYTGAIRHKGHVYPGQHAAILAPGIWERRQEQLVRDEPLPRGLSRNKHQALLQGLPHCEYCAAPVAYSYAVKNDRKYPYYVCRQAQRKGWATRPSKSLPAGALEESVLQHVRKTRGGGIEFAEWEGMERAHQLAAVRALIERVSYDGNSRRVSIRLRRPEIATGERARA